MHLKNLSLINYKNFETANFEFDTKINCLVGFNGVGKTNILDSIYHLAYGKSYFNPVTGQNINHDADFFVVDGEFEKLERQEKIVVSAKKGQKKIIKRNGKAYEKFSEHIGLIPVVIISPADRDLIVEGSETRRKFMDSIISQNDKRYLDLLVKYNKTLSQRNSLLKYFAANHTFDEATLSIYNEQMNEMGKVIHQKRIEFLEIFKPIFEQRYQSISNDKETVNLKYKSQLFENELSNLLAQNLQKDRALQYTSVGTHKDDLILKIEGHPVKKFGSQGQQKSFLIALKLAQYDFMKNQSKVNPILLLDDIFDKLDENRVAQIVDLVTKDDLGQLFISDTHAERTENVVKANAEQYKMIPLK
ncbi:MULTISPECIES: DNA replication/repair protein RecF [Mesonia]|uniref:DNA replication and repair protein RecF n=1 Tax=Mesonia oceanica TaxID=2687242 RepID=A0AC61YB86_9FLAO|nr:MULTISPECIES: DNA replication/repair protein RecF [Mesonia]MAN29103.1 DNA replication and repair protein RecF [Mesonia sp.]MAQ41827.1 DNA replication and repair protein RecF [Mesonia sp.]MBJ98335.1 DNA replication and repair protein RecF [Flavobacteriaceae bacterium]VVV01771.1 DNA replication and repair protein RecF [Mesonia oceanica]|tara:strand:- start:23856 stop:24938 length:1083 start_codon:yes stop_codon:yes gene_type:complete